MGRGKKCDYTSQQWDAVVERVKAGEITHEEAAHNLGMSARTFKVHYIANEGEEPPKKTPWKPVEITAEWCRIYRAYKAGRISQREAARRSGMSRDSFKWRVKRYEKALAASPLPEGWAGVVGEVKALRMTHTEAAKQLGISPAELRRKYWERTGMRLPRIWYVLSEWRKTA